VKSHRIRISGLSVILVVAIAAVAARHDVGPARPRTASPARPSVHAAEGSLGQGVVVHGHWTIAVFDPGGALVSRREFENALYAGEGDVLLASVLSHQAIPGPWWMDVGNTPAGSPCLSIKNLPLPCVSREVSPAAGASPLAVALSADGKTFSLAGSVVAQRDAAIDGVATGSQRCPPVAFTAGTPPPCSTGMPVYFTKATLTPPVNVVAGQTIQVTVTFSFS
jgi:hypothetical protein